ncbi:ribonuclease H [Senna tora]|uniref:Ribonuclease H n=1 Tax=Senna tora TaxID=362788 RepID=A0A834TK60_9FABA|nr:ribonuclease H [Senna tora]
MTEGGMDGVGGSEGVNEDKELGRTVLANGMRRSIGDGKSTNVWEDPWVIYDRPTTLTRSNQNATGVWKVCDLISEGGDAWDEDKLKRCFDEETCQRIMCLPPNRAQGGDKWVWEVERSGVYTVKSGYKHAMIDTWRQFELGLDIDADATTKFWKRLWKLPLLSRYKVFLWRVCWGVIPTVEALEHRGMEINEDCPMCNLETESVFHALIDCPEIQIVWVMANFDYSSRVYHANVLEWMVVEAGNWSDEKLCKAAVAMYCVWERRNAKKFSNEVIRAENLWPKVERITDEHLAATLIVPNNTMMPTTLEWVKPEHPLVKLNVDAAANRDGGGYLGGLVRDSEGCCLGAFMGSVHAPNDVVLLEALAIRKGLELALKIGCTQLLVEGDASLVIEMLKTPCTQASALSAVCKDILSFSENFQYVSFNWVPRICNSTADYITRQARIDQKDALWIDSVPFFLSEVLSFDE